MHPHPPLRPKNKFGYPDSPFQQRLRGIAPWEIQAKAQFLRNRGWDGEGSIYIAALNWCLNGTPE